MSTGEKVVLVLVAGAVVVLVGETLINQTAAAKVAGTNAVINNSVAQGIGIAGALGSIFGGSKTTSPATGYGTPISGGASTSSGSSGVPGFDDPSRSLGDGSIGYGASVASPGDVFGNAASAGYDPSTYDYSSDVPTPGFGF